MTKTFAWIEAARLRTLPLALSGCLVSLALVSHEKSVPTLQTLFYLLTVLLLQVLSNFANDLGDSDNGADNQGRVGPLRMVHSGRISKSEMKKAVVLFSVLSFVSGIYLLFLSGVFTHLSKAVFYMALGCFSILSAIIYTVGKNAYGYRGLGDLFVLVFFGFVSVIGGYALFSEIYNSWILLPAYAMGSLATAVLNLNNMRDVDSDKLAGKITIPARLGRKGAVIYHGILSLLPIPLLMIYCFVIWDLGFWTILLLLPFVLLTVLFFRVSKTEHAKDLDAYLKPTALITFLTGLIFLGLAAL